MGVLESARAATNDSFLYWFTGDQISEIFEKTEVDVYIFILQWHIYKPQIYLVLYH